MQKVFTLDTSVFVGDPYALYNFEDNKVIIPSTVLEEINYLKEEEETERGYNARTFARILDDITKQGSLRNGIKLGDTLIQASYDFKDGEVRKSLKGDKNDYRIIACAKHHDSILVTRDNMMRVIARDFVNVEEYMADTVKVDEVFKGYQRFVVPASKIAQLFSNKLGNEFDLHPNEFVILVNEENTEHTGVGICKKGRILPLSFDKFGEKGMKLKLLPLNLEQKMLLYLLLDPEINCVTVTGPSGKGKTLMTVDYALACIQAQLYNQFLYTKSVISVDRREELGFYKGGPEEKLKPHLAPLYSSIEYLFKKELFKGKERKSVDTKVAELLLSDTLSFHPLANIRGMSISEKVVMLDEAQNTTNHMIKSMVTRLNDDSKFIVTGDIEQIDDRNLNKFNNGLTHLVESGKGEEFIGHICMDISEESRRGKLATFGSKML